MPRATKAKPAKAAAQAAAEAQKEKFAEAVASVGLRVERVPIASLYEDPANVRIHNQKNIDAIKGSLRRFGQQEPLIVAPDGMVIAGNGRLRCMTELGWSEVDVVRSALDGYERVAYALASNRTAETAEWDFEGLSQTLAALHEQGVAFDDLGWGQHDLDNFLAADWSPKGEAGGELGGEERHHDAGDPIKVTASQREVIDRAIAVVRAEVGDRTTTEGRCLELICADFLAGAPTGEPREDPDEPARIGPPYGDEEG